MHTDESAGQCKRIDTAVLNCKKLEWRSSIGAIGDQAVTQRIQIVGYLRIIKISWIRANLPHDALAELTLLHRRQRRLRHISNVRQFIRQGNG